MLIKVILKDYDNHVVNITTLATHEGISDTNTLIWRGKHYGFQRTDWARTPEVTFGEVEPPVELDSLARA